MAQHKRKPPSPAAGTKGKPKQATTPRTKPAAKTPSSSTPPNPPNPIELPEGMWERVAARAYELWEQRGRREGHDLEDWLEAEALVMEEIHEARE